jgi:hypothetical protein
VLLENYAEQVEKATGIRCHVVGFDRAEGLPKAVDYRDMPYVWQPGFFRMDVEALRKRLRRAQLILGDVDQTLPKFIAKDMPPIGFVSFDLDFYSSTMEALQLLEQAPDRLLPRVFCYFDDCIGDDFELHSQFTGELLAIAACDAQDRADLRVELQAPPPRRLERDDVRDALLRASALQRPRPSQPRLAPPPARRRVAAHSFFPFPIPRREPR